MLAGLAGQLVAEAVQARFRKDAAGFQHCVTQLASAPGVTGWRRITERALAAAMQSAVTAAWRLGWQPADVVRTIGREQGNRHVGLATDAIAAEMRGYAEATVDDRWQAQLRSLGARAWWGQDDGYLRARGDHDWAAVVRCALEVLVVLTGLPRLPLLCPLPGTAHRRAGPAARARREPVDERMLTRIRRLAIDNPYEAPKAVLLDVVAVANRCRMVWHRQLGFSTVFGFAADLGAVELLFTSLLVQATTAMLRAGARRDALGRSRTRSFRQAFLAAYAQRIGERLRATADEATAHAAAESTGKDLLPVLAARDVAVDQAVGAMFPELEQRTIARSYDSEGWYSGRAAADAARLTAHAEVTRHDA